MWHRSYQVRLQSWSDLRTQCQALDPQICLQEIQAWWHSAPWCPYYLHWDDRKNWPDPWQLLADDRYCGLAKTLGMLYTVRLLDRSDAQDATMIEIENNLVLVRWGKYIVNWDDPRVVNILSNKITIKRILESEVLDHLIGE